MGLWYDKRGEIWLANAWRFQELRIFVRVFFQRCIRTAFDSSCRKAFSLTLMEWRDILWPAKMFSFHTQTFTVGREWICLELPWRLLVFAKEVAAKIYKWLTYLFWTFLGYYIFFPCFYDLVQKGNVHISKWCVLEAL